MHWTCDCYGAGPLRGRWRTGPELCVPVHVQGFRRCAAAVSRRLARGWLIHLKCDRISHARARCRPTRPPARSRRPTKPHTHVLLPPFAGSTMKSVVAINGVKASSYVGVRIQARVQPPRAARVAVVQCVAEDESERLRLNNLSPQEGARRKKTRKGRGYGAGQGGTAGYGMRGQKSRSGSGIRPGFEGGQTPLYRKLPKLRGIAGGMGHGLPDYVRILVLISHRARLAAFSRSHWCFVLRSVCR